MSELYKLPDGWEWKKLEDIIRIGCERGFKPTVIDDKVPFIGMTDIDKHTGRNTKYILEENSKVSKGKTKFQKNAVLLGKITPCTQNNKTTIVPEDIDGGYATTEVYALHCLEKIMPLYFNYYIRSNRINSFLVSSMIGATGRQRVPSETVKNLNIPLPPLSEQQRIVSKLDNLFEKIDRAMALHQKNMDEADLFMGSVLNDVFLELENKYTNSTLGELISVSSGNYFNKKEYTNDGVRIFKINNVTFGKTKWKNVDYLPRDYIEKFPSLVLKEKDLVIALNRPLLGNKLKITFLSSDDTPSILYQRVGKIEPKDENMLSKDFIYWYFNSPKFIEIFESKLLGSDQPYINNKNLYSIIMPLAPLNVQNDIVIHIKKVSKKIERTKQIQKEKMQSLVDLKASILDQAFRGEL